MFVYGPVEGHDDRVVHPQRLEQGELLVERRQLAHPLAAAQRHARMGIERHDDALAGGGTRLGDDPLDQGPVTQMDAVVGTHRHGRMAEYGQGVESSENTHRIRSCWRYPPRSP